MRFAIRRWMRIKVDRYRTAIDLRRARRFRGKVQWHRNPSGTGIHDTTGIHWRPIHATISALVQCSRRGIPSTSPATPLRNRSLPQVDHEGWPSPHHHSMVKVTSSILIRAVEDVLEMTPPPLA